MLLMSLGAFASEYLAPVKNVKILVKMPGEMLPVQPASFITFTITSCAKREDLVIEKAAKSYNEVEIKIVDRNPMDCRMKGIDRQYTLQISSDASNEKYVLLNPLRAEYVK